MRALRKNTRVSHEVEHVTKTRDSFLPFEAWTIIARLFRMFQLLTRTAYAVLLAAGPASFSLSAFAQNPVSTNNTIRWVDIRQLGVEGRGWNDTRAFYDRLPAKAEGKVHKPVWDLSRNSAGMCVRFVSDATVLHARWGLTESWLYLQNITAIAKSGLDLYAKTDGGEWRWLAVGSPTGQTNTVKLVENLRPGKREYLLYLPLYN